MDKTTSTNDLARNLSGGDEDFVVVAEEQTSGRGRLNRKWISPKGGLYFSLCCEQEPLLPLKAATAVAQTLDDLGVPPSLKWPNDVLVDGKKICGILVEIVGSKAVIGVGVNMDSTPIKGSTCVHHILERPVSSETIMDGIITRFKRINHVLETYKQYSSTIGKEVVIKTPSGNVSGRVEDIDEKGRIVLDNGSSIISGDVIYLRSKEN